MQVGVPKEIKNQEYRIGLTPSAVKELTSNGHAVLVEHNGGAGVGFDDAQYKAAGATIAQTAEQIFAEADMIVKIKEPQLNECRMLRKGQLLFTYLHLAASPRQAELLLESGATCIAYETVTDTRGGLPLLTPMSEIAGRMSIQAAAHHLEKTHGGSGTLLGGVPGVAPAKVMIIGGGVVGTNAAYMAIGMGADVSLLDRSLPRLRELDAIFGNRLKTVHSSVAAIEKYAAMADVIIGSVLIPGAATPQLIHKAHLKSMRDGSVIVDVAIDQGGCFETSKATTHQDPTYVVEGVVHYCVSNIPSGVARTATIALNNATMPYVISLVNKGVKEALLDDAHLAEGLNVHEGKVTHSAVARSLSRSCTPAAAALSSATSSCQAV